MYQFILEEHRPRFRDMGPRAVFQELVDDAVAGHATALFRFSPAIQYLSKKWKTHPEKVFSQFDAAVREHRPTGPPVHPPIDLSKLN